MAEQVKLDIFDPPHHKLTTRHSIKIRGTSQGVWNTICQVWDIHRDHTIDRNDHHYWWLWTGITKTLPYSNEELSMDKGRNWKKLLTVKVIHNSRWSWSAPIIVVQKEDRGKQLVINYRALNKVTRKFTWPMPKVKDTFSRLNGAKYFSTLDLRAGYHHIPFDKSLIPKTAFNSPFSKYEYVKEPFRLAQAPAYFQEFMTRILKDFDFAIVYLDNIILSEQQMNTCWTSGRFLKNFNQQNFPWN